MSLCKALDIFYFIFSIIMLVVDRRIMGTDDQALLTYMYMYVGDKGNSSKQRSSKGSRYCKALGGTKYQVNARIFKVKKHPQNFF